MKLLFKRCRIWTALIGVFPYDVRKEFGKGRVKVHAPFDGCPYDGSLARMGMPEHITGLPRDIRQRIQKSCETMCGWLSASGIILWRGLFGACLLFTPVGGKWNSV